MFQIFFFFSTINKHKNFSTYFKNCHHKNDLSIITINYDLFLCTYKHLCESLFSLAHVMINGFYIKCRLDDFKHTHTLRVYKIYCCDGNYLARKIPQQWNIKIICRLKLLIILFHAERTDTFKAVLMRRKKKEILSHRSEKREIQKWSYLVSFSIPNFFLIHSSLFTTLSRVSTLWFISSLLLFYSYNTHTHSLYFLTQPPRYHEIV